MPSSEASIAHTAARTGHDKVWAVVPCGGSGSRAGTPIPKQYQPVAGLPVVAHTLLALARTAEVTAALLVVAENDEWVNGPLTGVAPESAVAAVAAVAAVSHGGGLTALVHRARAACGLPIEHEGEPWLRIWPAAGPTRAHTVFNGLTAWQQMGAHQHDWALVHDAARCLATPAQISSLIAACRHDPVGGLLALKLPDTLKQGVNGRASATVPRDDKWLAQTPQMFRLGDLHWAMEAARRSDFAHITDEASAMELQGQMPLLVPGTADNFKVTYPPDFALAQAILQAR